jgi:hypothetical protein
VSASNRLTAHVMKYGPGEWRAEVWDAGPFPDGWHDKAIWVCRHRHLLPTEAETCGAKELERRLARARS